MVRYVLIEEDATNIQARIDVDEKTGLLHGLIGSPLVMCPPTESELRQFLLGNARNIAQQMIVHMLVPITSSSSPPLCAHPVGFYATNGSFTAADLSIRHSLIIRALRQHGLTAIGDGADGDRRNLKLQLAHFQATHVHPGPDLVLSMTHPLLVWRLIQLWFSFQDVYVCGDMIGLSVIVHS